MGIRVFLIVLLISSSASLAADDTIYRWVDENGTTHVTDKATDAPGTEVLQVRDHAGIRAVATNNTQNGQSGSESTENSENTETEEEPLSYAQQRKKERAERRAERDKKRQETQAECDRMRNQLRNTGTRTRVLKRNDDGEVVRMDDEERVRLVNEAQAYLDENCN